MAASVDAVVLDLGNVLVFHDNAYLFRRLASLARLSPEEVSARFPTKLWDEVNRGVIADDGIRQAVCSALGMELPHDLFLAVWNSHFRMHEEVLPLVEQLIGRVKVALLSNTNSLHARFLLPQLPMLERFDAVLLSHEREKAKPDAEFFKEALSDLAVEPSRAVFFDDIPEYVKAAESVGMHGRVFTTATAFREQLAELGL